MGDFKKIVVTGNLGYIGSVTVPFLLREGYEVIGFDTGFFEGEDFIKREVGPNYQIKKDIRDIDQKDLDGIDAIIHFAALSDIPQEKLGSDLMMEINFKASVRLASLAKEAGVKRFIFTSSCSAYGKADGDKLVTEESEFNPVSPYGLSKIKSEEGILKLADENFCPVFLRNATCYGISPRMRFDLVVNNLMGHAFCTGEIKIFSDGTPWRPIVHIEDVARANLAILGAPRDRVFGQAFNVGQNLENYQIRDIANIISETIPGLKVDCLNITGPDKRSYRVGFDKIKNLGNFQPQWNLKSYISVLYEKLKEINFSQEEFISYKYNTYSFYEHLIKNKKIKEDLRWV
jgi:nucleoside-diphosphate-sugar epimerase